MVEMLMLGINI